MAISLQGTASAVATTVTLPTHAADDILVIYATSDDGNIGSPRPFPAGWTSVIDSTNANGTQLLAWKKATSSGETSGTWSNVNGSATMLIAWVFRGADLTDPIGASGVNPVLSGSSLTFPALTLEQAGGTSWVTRGGFVKSTTPNLSAAAVSGYSFRQNPIDGAVAQSLGIDSDGPETTVTADSVALGGTYQRGALSVEILEATGGGGLSAGALAYYYKNHRSVQGI